MIYQSAPSPEDYQDLIEIAKSGRQRRYARRAIIPIGENGLIVLDGEVALGVRQFETDEISYMQMSRGGLALPAQEAMLVNHARCVTPVLVSQIKLPLLMERMPQIVPGLHWSN